MAEAGGNGALPFGGVLRLEGYSDLLRIAKGISVYILRIDTSCRVGIALSPQSRHGIFRLM